MTESKIAIDSNILIYLHQLSSGTKFDAAVDLISMKPVVSTQVVSEYVNVLRRILQKPKAEILHNVSRWLRTCMIVPVLHPTIDFAATLIERYDFQIFDAIIVATAIEAGCNILYSEDMQHGLVVKDTLTIINPFI